MSIEAMKQALEGLENVAITGPDDDNLVWLSLLANSATVKAFFRVGDAGTLEAQCAQLFEEQRAKAITALRSAIEQAEKQEPVAYVSGYYAGRCVIEPLNRAMVMPDGMALYTAPPAAPVNRDAQKALFEGWWEREGQFGRSGGGQYEKTFAWNAWCAAPAAQRQPLTVEEIEQVTGCDRTKPLWIAIEGVVRAVERKHEIGGGE